MTRPLLARKETRETGRDIVGAGISVGSLVLRSSRIRNKITR